MGRERGGGRAEPQSSTGKRRGGHTCQSHGAESQSGLRTGPESVAARRGRSGGRSRTGRSRADGPDLPRGSRLLSRRRWISSAPPPSYLFLSPSFPSLN